MDRVARASFEEQLEDLVDDIARVSRRRFLSAGSATIGATAIAVSGGGVLALTPARAEAAVPCPPPGFPSGIPVQVRTYQNWSGDIADVNLCTADVSNSEQVAEIANWAKHAGYEVRARGFSHNWSPLVVPKGTEETGKVLIVDTRGMDAAKPPVFHPGDPASATFTAGTTLEDATAWLAQQGGGDPPGYTFPSMTAPGRLTLGGILAIGGHGTGVPWERDEPELWGSLSNLILGFKAIVTDPDGLDPDEYVIKEFSRDDPDASAFLVHLGRAFVTEVTLQVVPNYYLQVVHSFPHFDELFEAPGPSPSPHSFSQLLDDYGRVEAIWFPFTDTPWIKTWERVDQRIEPQELGPYTYLDFANNISQGLSDFIKFLVQSGLISTPAFSNFQLNAVLSGTSPKPVANGTARDLLLYVTKDTLRVTAFGYALLVPRRFVQMVLHTFAFKLREMLQAYAGQGRYPMNGPMEIRVTSVDDVGALGAPDASPGALSASRPVPPLPGFDTIIWLDALTFPGTTHADRFFRELERWLVMKAGILARPEWSKGWGYTASAGAWTDPVVIGTEIPRAYNAGTGGFDWALGRLADYDKYNVWSNAFLDALLPG